MLDYRKLTRNGQLTLPMWFRDKYQLESGVLVELVEVEGGILIKPMKAMHKKSAVQDLIDFLQTAGDRVKGKTEDEILEMINQEIKVVRKKDETHH